MNALPMLDVVELTVAQTYEGLRNGALRRKRPHTRTCCAYRAIDSSYSAFTFRNPAPSTARRQSILAEP